MAKASQMVVEVEFKQIEPQKARGIFKAAKGTPAQKIAYIKDNFGPEWVAEEKFDGDRRIGQFVDGLVRLTGTRQSVKDGLFVEKTANVPHISGVQCAEIRPLASAKNVRKLNGTILDMEMIVPEGFVTGAGGKSKHVTSIMGSLPAEAIRKQLERGLLRCAVFDILAFKGQTLNHLPLHERRKWLEKAMREWNNPHAFVVPQEYDDKAGFLESVWARGGEGIILKHTQHMLGQHLLWIKVKEEATADVIIIGYKDPKEMSEKVTGIVSPTKYAGTGLIGSIIFGQLKEGQIVRVGSTNGMDEKTRELISLNKEHYISQVIEIKHYGREADTGAFRHPQFSRFRPDKSCSDCQFYLEEV